MFESCAEFDLGRLGTKLCSTNPGRTWQFPCFAWNSLMRVVDTRTDSTHRLPTVQIVQPVQWVISFFQFLSPVCGGNHALFAKVGVWVWAFRGGSPAFANCIRDRETRRSFAFRCQDLQQFLRIEVPRSGLGERSLLACAIL